MRDTGKRRRGWQTVVLGVAFAAPVLAVPVAWLVPGFPLAPTAAKPSQVATTSNSPQPQIVPEDYEALFDLGGCSGALARFPSSRPDDKALVLTAGHCVGRVDHSTAMVVNGPVAQANPVTLLDADGGDVAVMGVERTEYAGSPEGEGADLGVLRLEVTYAELHDRYGAQPRTIAEDAGAVGTALRISSGFWREETVCRQTSRPGSSGAVTFEVGAADEPCSGIRPGWSGSPVVRESDGQIIAVDSVAVYIDGTQQWNAGPPAALLLSCLTADRHVSLEVRGCQLG